MRNVELTANEMKRALCMAMDLSWATMAEPDAILKDQGEVLFEHGTKLFIDSSGVYWLGGYAADNSDLMDALKSIHWNFLPF